MGKQAKTKKGKERAINRKVDKTTLPKPPPPVTNEIGSAKLLDEPKSPGGGHKALDRDGYDDGGVADLTLVIDLEDSVLRRKRGETAYFTALKADLLPRVTTGQLANTSRRDQKVKLAKILFSEEMEGHAENSAEANPSEVWNDNVDGTDDEATKKKRKDRLDSAKYALRLSTILREPACASLSLSEISKRYLSCYGKEFADAALRCADKAILIASDGFYDSDAIAIEANDEPKIDPKYEENATSPGLSHPTTLKLQPIRVSQLCLRSAYLHRGNALSALGRNQDARETYEKVIPMLAEEPRCGRLDWERSSILVNIGNTHSRENDYDKADEQYTQAEQLGKDHLDHGDDEGNKMDGMGIMICAQRARAFALNKSGREDEAKKTLRGVLELQMKLNEETEKKKKKDAEEAAASKEAEEKAAAEEAKNNPELIAES